MENIYVIVEGLTDVKYISQLLGPYLEGRYKLLLYQTGGFNRMLSSIRPILDQVPIGSKVLFLFDADTRNQERVEERLDFMQEQMGYVRKECKIAAFCFIPDIEESLLGDEESYMSRRKVDPIEVIDYIDKHRDALLKRTPVKDIIAFIEDKNQKQNSV